MKGFTSPHAEPSFIEENINNDISHLCVANEVTEDGSKRINPIDKEKLNRDKEKLNRAFKTIEIIANLNNIRHKINNIPFKREGSFCNLCSNGEMRIRQNSFNNTLFLGCSNYPDCKFSANVMKEDENKFKEKIFKQMKNKKSKNVFSFSS